MEDERRPSRGGAEIDGERSLGTRGRGRESAGSWAGVGPSGEEGQQRSMASVRARLERKATGRVGGSGRVGLCLRSGVAFGKEGPPGVSGRVGLAKILTQ
jgi:hypothetical protein